MDAFLVHRNQIYRAFENESTHTAVSALIYGIWTRFPDHALSMLRERIYTNYSLTPLCEGSIKVCAKRATELSKEAYQSKLEDLRKSHSEQTIRASLPPTFEISGFPHVFQSIAGAAKALSQNSMDSITAILLSPSLQVLGFAKNTNDIHRAQHAETNLIQNYLISTNTKLKPGTKILISLKPCAMCAAQIYAAAERFHELEVYYLNDDPGPKAKNSVLIKDSDLWKRAGSPALPKFAQLLYSSIDGQEQIRFRSP